jgi:hypothetical protein
MFTFTLNLIVSNREILMECGPLSFMRINEELLERKKRATGYGIDGLCLHLI